MSGLQRFRDRLIPGVLLTCIENTWRPYRNGVEHRVTGLNCGLVGCRRVTGETGLITVTLPAQRDFAWVDDNTATWKLGIGNHSVTYRIGYPEAL